MSKIRLSPIKDTDYHSVQNMWSDLKQCKLISASPSFPSLLQVSQELSTKNSSSRGRIGLYTLDQDRFIGYTTYTIYLNNPLWYEIGISLLPDAKGNGYGTQSINLLIDYLTSFYKAEAFFASVRSSNKSALNLFNSLDFLEYGSFTIPSCFDNDDTSFVFLYKSSDQLT